MSELSNFLMQRRKRRKRTIIVLSVIISLCIITATAFLAWRMITDADATTAPETTEQDAVKSDTQKKEEKKQAQEEQRHKEALQSENEWLTSLSEELAEIMLSEYPEIDLSFGIKNLDTGAEVYYNNKQMNSASVIKLFILETVYKGVADGSYFLTESGKKDLEIMITESNNNAANNFIDDFGGQNEKRKIEETNHIIRTIKASGYEYTEINRKMHDTTPPEGPSGYQNYTSPKDVVKFLEGIYKCTLLEEPYNSQTLELLKNQKRRGKIPAEIANKYPSIIVANKTGELSQVENDVAVIMCDEFNLAFALFTDNIALNEDGSTNYARKEQVQKTISKVALRLVEAYKTK